MQQHLTKIARNLQKNAGLSRSSTDCDVHPQHPGQHVHENGGDDDGDGAGEGRQ